MAVPAHVRNDMQSHLNLTKWFTKWFNNPFEKYVTYNSSAIYRQPEIAAFFTPVKTTDFWDNNSYTGSNPNDGYEQGLAEYTNANFFSDNTIPVNRPSTKHSFPYPQIRSTDRVCTDWLPGSSPYKTKYVSRTACPTDGSPVDHFAAVSLLNPIGTTASTVMEAWLDDNVHKTYAQQILPRAVGYSASLLNYFIRGNIEVQFVQEDITFRTIKVKAKNITPYEEEMEPGEVALVVRYKELKESPLEGSRHLVHYSSDEYSYKVAKLQNVTIPRDAPVELTFDFSADTLPINFDDISLQLVYKGKLGQEDGSVAVSELKELTGVHSDFYLSLPSSGVFAKIDATENEFSELKVTALTDIPGGISLTGGKIELALEYRKTSDSPFQNLTINFLPTDAWSYIIRVPEKNGVTTLPEGVPVELAFDLSSAPLPIYSSDVYVNIVCTGTDTEGNEKTKAIGFLDISEPTPVDIFNTTDKACINNQWYDAGSPEAISLVGEGTLADVYPDNIDNTFQKVSPVNSPSYASSSNYIFSSPAVLTPGGYRRLGYILTDYEFKISAIGDWHYLDPNDSWGRQAVPLLLIDDGQGFKLQTDDDGSIYYDGMNTMYGIMYWVGAAAAYRNWPYPFDSDCSFNALK